MPSDRAGFRWGIIGCGTIAPRFVNALKNTGEGFVVAAASKSMRRAKRFRRKTGIAKTYNSCEAMLENEQLDAVYIATTHNFHAENAKLCLEHGVPALLEKTFTQNAQQAAEIVGLARSKNLFLMEAMWTRFNPATVRLRELLAEGAIGDIEKVEARLCVRMKPWGPKMWPWNRMYSPKLAGGALLDLGIYPIAYARMVFGQAPSDIAGSASMTWTGVDKTSEYQLDYPTGGRAEIAASFVEKQPRDAVVTGTKGTIRIPDFYRADRLIVDGETMPCAAPGFEYQIREVHRCLREGLAESPDMPLDETLETMRTLDALRAQWNMKYPNEKN